MSTILIVDDSASMRQQLHTILNTGNHVLLEADNGAKALELIKQQSIDLMTLDLMMPVMTGIEVLIKLQHQAIVMPIIVITADDRDATHQQCLQLGAYATMVKPPQKNKLLRLVDEILYA